ncbi:MAG: haloacid dehalogenase [Clostridiales bacterium]|nr:haloacid dehalogenase [Clostridiales bacterium]
MKILVACDLDNTLLHSKRRRQEGDVCTEYIHEKEQGYMTKKALEMLPQVIHHTIFVPVTTRSIAQYRRILWPDAAYPRYAAVTNGAILLDGAETNAEWLAQSEDFAAPYQEEMKRLQEELIARGGYDRCKIIDEMYLYAHYPDEKIAWDLGKEYEEKTSLQVSVGGRKVYFLPPAFQKGGALQRLADRFQPDYIIAAGDSRIDVPMLKMADAALVPTQSMEAHVQSSHCLRCPEGTHFSEFVLKEILHRL